MSADVKKHLSARHRTEIHLYRREQQPEMAGATEEASASADAEIGDPTRAPLNPVDSNGTGAVSGELASGPVPVVFLAQSKSVKP
jgi:hypothetical protein